MKKTKNSTGTELYKKAQRLRSNFEIVLLLFENDDHDFSVAMAIECHKTIESLLNDIGDPEVQPIQKRALTTKQEINTTKGKDIHSSLIETRRIIDSLIEYIENKYSIGYQLVNRLIKNRKKIISVLLVTLGLFILGYFIRHITKSPNGLIGEYYADLNLNNLVKKRQDKEINFRWGKNSPLPHFPSDLFSVRWQGFLKVDKPGTYTLSTVSDDGVKLWVDKKLVIKNWTRHKEEIDEVKLTLKEGYHPIRIEYFENYKTAVIQLFWQHEKDSTKTIIPNENLFIRKK